MLRQPAWSVAVTGFVEAREERERSDRIVVRTHTIEGRRVEPAPQRVRVAVRKGTAPAVGAFVDVQGASVAAAPAAAAWRLRFRARHVFLRLGASGYVLGRITTAPPPADAGGAWLRYAAAVEGMREAIDKRIRAVIPGDAGAIASALITGKRGAISPAVKDAFYVSSLAHVLAISGFHMAVVTGHRVLFHSRRAGVDPVAGEPPADQEMGRRRRVRRRRRFIWCSPAPAWPPSAPSS